MSNDYYNASGYPAPHAAGASLNARGEFSNVGVGFDKLPPLTGHALELLRVNAAGTAIESYANPYLTTAAATATYLPLVGGSLAGPGNLTVGGTLGVTGLATFGALTTTGNTILGDAATDTLNVGNGGIIKDASGRVGIGMSPSFPLDVLGTAHVSGQFDNGGQQGITTGLVLGGFGISYGRVFEVSNDLWQLGYSGTRTGAVTGVLNWNASGNVGIGVSPSARLHSRVDGAGSTTTGLMLDNGAAGAGTNVSALAFANAGAVKASITAAVYGNDYMTFNVGSNTERMRIDASGNAGLVTAGARLIVGAAVGGGASQLYVFKTGAVDVPIESSSNTVSTAFGTNSSVSTNAWGAPATSSYIGNQAAYPLVFTTNGAERMRLDSSGNVGIGTSPIHRLDVRSTSTTNNDTLINAQNDSAARIGLQVFGTAAAAYGMWAANEAGIYSASTMNIMADTGGVIKFASGGANERMRLDSSGRVGIGMSPSFPLDVLGTAHVSGQFDNGGQQGITTGLVLGGIGSNYGRVLEVSNDLWQLGYSGTRTGAVTGVLNWNSSGNVGIGKTPSVKLDVQGISQFYSGAAGTLNHLNVGRTSSEARIGVAAATNDFLTGSAAGDTLFYNVGAGNAWYGGAGAGSAIIATNNVERLRIDASGNVGIGAAPTYKLDVLATGSPVIRVASTDGSGVSAYLQANSNVGANVGAISNHPLLLVTNSIERMRITAAGVIQDVNGLELGYRKIPAASVTTGAFIAADSGKCVFATAGVTVPNSTMAQGDAVSIYNNTAASITITATVTTLRQAGTANTGNRTLAARGMATVLFISGTEAVISGAGLT